MNKDWFTLIETYTISGARDRFETICATLFKKLHPNRNVRLVKVKQGDGGIDIFIGEIGIEPINVIQCKFFPREFGDAQKAQIRKSFNTSIESNDYDMSNWTLCVFCTLDINENIWWAKWKDKMYEKHNLSNKFIKLIDGDDLIDLLNENNLYNDAFEKEDSKKIGEIHENLIPKLDFQQLNKSLIKASLFLDNVKNHFEKETSTHIDRSETNKIIQWVKNDLQLHKKNLLVLEGDKGLGKSVILKDTYNILKNEGFLVLGIKADKYYALSPKELENKLFINSNISFSTLIEFTKTYDKKLVIIIDQLDALSQTLSSSREYIQTYNRVINELLNEKNIRIIISSRSYDLKYDAELSTYKSKYYNNIKTTLLSELEVTNTLGTFNVKCSIKKVIELLRTPNHLEIFCKLPSKQKINLNTLSSLKDLYDELWNTLVLDKNELELDSLLFKIAAEMYSQQQIVIRRRSISKFKSELNYLFSNQLLILEDSNIQFFHQTFYDYCFAKHFVENGKDIHTYLKRNQQNLEIRSIIKMVFEYLREYDHKKYLRNVKKILKSSKYRFHIKSLIINDVGLVNPSVDEIEVLEKHILKNKLYEDVFINSVISEKWIEHIIDSKISDKYLFIEKRPVNSLYDIYKKQTFFKSLYLEGLNIQNEIDYKTSAIWMLFRNNINKAPYKIISYLDTLADFPSKQNFIERLLYNLDFWDDANMLHFFEKYISFNKQSNGNDNFWFYQKLEKIFEHYPKYVLDKIHLIIVDNLTAGNSWQSNDFSHSQEVLLKNIYTIAPEKSFWFLLNVYEQVINENKQAENYQKIDSPLYSCNQFYDGISVSKDGHFFIQEYLLNHLLQNKKRKEYIQDFYKKYKNSNSIHLLRLLILFFKEAKELYINEIFKIINIIHIKNGLNSLDDKFQLYIRELIGESFILFSEAQKEKLTDILLDIRYPYDLEGRKYEDANGDKKVYFSGYGKKQYLFMCSLPVGEIKNNPRLKIVFQEFKRRFGELDSNKAMDSSSGGAYVVGAPLEPDAYINMNLKSWKKSILKFDNNYREGHGPKGGIIEHSRAFSEIVKKNGDKFYEFILNLFDDKNVSITYLSSGINGLIEGDYNPIKVKVLYKKLINLNLDRTNTLYTIWKSGYLIEHKLIDKDIITFLSENALNHPNPEKPLNDDDPLFDSLNTVRGAAINKIIKCYEYEAFSDIIFETVEKATNDSQLSVIVSILQELAFLNHLDIERSFKIFMKIVNVDEIHILRNSMRACEYFNNKYHNKMYSYFHKIIDNKELHKDGQVIVLSWLFESINDKKLFEIFFNSSKEAKLCALRVAEKMLIDRKGGINKKSLKILFRLLNQKDKDFSNLYSGVILRKMKLNNFKQLYPFLIKYSKTILCINQPSYFLQLLLTCAKEYPLECLNLIENMNFKKTPNIQERGYYRDEPVQLVLAIYSKLNMDLKNNRKNVLRTLDVFDSMLKHSHLRQSANNAIELIK